ncbi:MAG: undecaprenyl phosphate translocase family protein [Candidatus Nanoarchaeia archaeon]
MDNNKHNTLKSSKLKELPNLYYFPIGLLMGIADSLPGFSGSTVLLLFKQYETIMNTLSSLLRKQFFLDILYSTQHLSFNRLIQNYNLFLLLSLFTGIGIGLFSSFFTIATFIELYPDISNLIILIITILITLYYIIIHRVEFKHMLKSRISILFMLIPLSVFSTLFIALQSIQIISSSPILFFVSAFFAIMVMLLPGISGSLMLVLFGTYTQLKTALLEMNFILIIPFIVGIILGAILSIKYISHATTQYPLYSKYVILSLLLSAIITLSFSVM